MYDAEGYEYPIDEYGQITFPLNRTDSYRAGIGGKYKRNKNLKRFCVDVASASAMICSFDTE